MSPVIEAVLIALGLFIGLLVVQLAGRWAGQRRSAPEDTGKSSGSVVDGAVFGLLGLLLAFTFSGANSRYEHRRDLLVDHVNAVETAWLRLGMLPASEQPALRARFRDYVDALNAAAQTAAVGETDPAHLRAVVDRVQSIQDEIWTLALAAVQLDPRPQVASLLLPALNQSFDLASSRLAASRFGIQQAVILLLLLIALLAGWLVGNGQAGTKHPDLLHMVVFAALISAMLWFILDFDSPRVGIINLGSYDTLMLELRERMH